MNYNKYIGIPYKTNGRDSAGIDCWGLVRLFYSQELKIELPSYESLYTSSKDLTIPVTIKEQKDSWKENKEGTIGDVCIFNIYGEPAHVGIYVGNNKFLHAREGSDSVIESLDSPMWSKRFQGFFSHSTEQQIRAVGSPHPLHTSIAADWVAVGNNIEDFVKVLKEKYTLSDRLTSRLIVLVDGQEIPKDQWATFKIEVGQTIAYKAVAEGNAGRLLTMLVVMYIAINTGNWAIGNEAFGGMVSGATGSAAAANMAASGFTYAATVAAVNMAGMALINAIAPVRQPNGQDPGTARTLNLFTGSSNSINRFGAIPVVLGRMRITGIHGATPYVDTLTETSLLNMLIVWGIGPLKVDDICVGSSSIKNYYSTADNSDPDFAQNIPQPITLHGIAGEDDTQFNNLYGTDVEQANVSVVELVNNTSDGNPWRYAQLNNPNTEIAMAFSFPVGMRQLVVSGDGAGDIREATAGVEIQYRRYTSTPGDLESWTDRAPYYYGDYSSTSSASATAYNTTLTSTRFPTSSYSDENGTYSVYTDLYQWYIICSSPGGNIFTLQGAGTDNKYQEPSATLISAYKSGSYASLVGAENTYTRLPPVPAGYMPLHTICLYRNEIVEHTVNVDSYYEYTGFDMLQEPITQQVSDGDYGYISQRVGTKIIVNGGFIAQAHAAQPQAGVAVTVFDSANLASGGNVVRVSNRVWCTFLNEKGIWTPNATPGQEFTNITNSVSFPYSGYYNITASCDDEGAVYVDNRPVATIPSPGYNSTIANLTYIEAGTYPVRLYGKNSGNGAAGIGCTITYTSNGGLNSLPASDTVLVFGSPGFYSKRRDAFNFVYRMRNLPRAKYEIRVRRTNSDETEPTKDLRNYNKVQLFSVTGFDLSKEIVNGVEVPRRPIKQLPNNAQLARTAIRIQSTNKANGNVDGVNAVVQTIAKNYNSTTGKWESGKPTSNPASLFLYVLTHPANAYRIEEADIYNKIDMPALQDWYTFCESKGFEYNEVISNTKSVIDTLRDICAVALASPNFVDGKWTVVVDKPRDYVVQHFTPHNSWGFEASKILPRTPHAFRVTFANRLKAWQTDEILIYNYGYAEFAGNGSKAATIFEQLDLPGVTSEAHAKFLARWHMAQLKLRPERYTINADFEYLICNRGDLVRVTHDVPRWGVGSGRIKSITSNVITLTEPALLSTTKSYNIRIRTNTGASVVLPVTVSTDGWHETVQLSTGLPSSVEVDNLFMLGEIGTESQELIVLSIEPSTNVSARISLMDYSPEIYTSDLTGLLTFNANITGASTQIVRTTINGYPTIVGVASGSPLSEEISTGIYQNTTIVSYANSSGLTDEAKLVQLQYVLGDAEFESNSPSSLISVNKASGSIIINGLKTMTIYKFRVRYANAVGTNVGPWSPIYVATVVGKDTNYSEAPALTLDLDNTYITVKPTYVVRSPDFAAYEYRLYKDTGTEDFWELDVTANDIKVMRSSQDGKFDLRDQPLPRISAQGVTYRIACRSVDRSNNYSDASTLGTIVIKTIQ